MQCHSFLKDCPLDTVSVHMFGCDLISPNDAIQPYWGYKTTINPLLVDSLHFVSVVHSVGRASSGKNCTACSWWTLSSQCFTLFWENSYGGSFPSKWWKGTGSQCLTLLVMSWSSYMDKRLPGMHHYTTSLKRITYLAKKSVLNINGLRFFPGLGCCLLHCFLQSRSLNCLCCFTWRRLV